MPARTPAEICPLFQRAMADGDLAALLQVYDPEAVFVQESGEVTKGRDALRKVLTPLAASKPRFDYEILQIAETDGVALMHTQWTVSVSGAPPRRQHAIEVARRQPDGSWRWLIGDPFTVDKG